jgi:hypothetical protein
MSHEDVFTFIAIARWILLRIRNVLDKSSRENQNTHFIFRNFFRISCHLWYNVEKSGAARISKNGVTIWRTPVACCISKATCTHTHAHAHAIRHKHTQMCNTGCYSMATTRDVASVLHYTYIICLFPFPIAWLLFSCMGCGSWVMVLGITMAARVITLLKMIVVTVTMVMIN